jgi:hypothetical protein
MVRSLILLISLFLTLSLSAFSQDHAPEPAPPAIVGRWDLTVNMGDRIVPSWLEVEKSGLKTLVGHFVAEGGSARPISIVNFVDGKVGFSIPPQWELSDKNMILEGILENDRLSGTIISSLGKIYSFTGERAPLLKRSAPVVWGEPIQLFNGRDISGWHPSGQTNQWVVENGILKSPRSGSNIISDQTFEDFQLHIEFRYPAHSNSGVYLRGRYEVQVSDDAGSEPSSHLFGGIYGFLTPNEMAAKKAGEWQSYDVTLVGRTVSVVANGKKIITEQIIPGITGGALDSKEGAPGPIMMQGDHGPIEYRNIVITPAKKF